MNGEKAIVSPKETVQSGMERPEAPGRTQKICYTLRDHIEDFRMYVEWVEKYETPEESREALIRTGVLDENGKLHERHRWQ